VVVRRVLLALEERTGKSPEIIVIESEPSSK
jgi:hypothetical protein